MADIPRQIESKNEDQKESDRHNFQYRDKFIDPGTCIPDMVKTVEQKKYEPVNINNHGDGRQLRR